VNAMFVSLSVPSDNVVVPNQPFVIIMWPFPQLLINLLSLSCDHFHSIFWREPHPPFLLPASLTSCPYAPVHQQPRPTPSRFTIERVMARQAASALVEERVRGGGWSQELWLLRFSFERGFEKYYVIYYVISVPDYGFINGCTSNIATVMESDKQWWTAVSQWVKLKGPIHDI
jgi:hypothetical protein